MAREEDNPQSIRRRVWILLENPEGHSQAARRIDIALIVLISCNVLAVTLESVESIHQQYRDFFIYVEWASVFIFTIEYLLRLWSGVEAEDDDGRRVSRLQVALRPMMILDLLAILPFYLALILPMDLRFMRALRLLRIFKLTRYSQAMGMLTTVFREEARSFMAGFFILLVLLIFASSGAYLAEHKAQPEKFGSIPAAMWWAMATLTTVGYGDVTPVTVTGKLFGGIVTLLGIGMAALPAGILASGMADQLRHRREQLESQFRQALEDGVIDPDEEVELEALRRRLGIGRQLSLRIRSQIQAEREQQDRHCTCPNCGHQFPMPEPR